MTDPLTSQEIDRYRRHIVLAEIGGAGEDRLDGGTGIDTVSYADAASKVTVDLSRFTNASAEGDSVNAADAQAVELP